MKTIIHTTLLLTFIFVVLPAVRSEAQTKDKKYKNFYREINKKSSNPEVITSEKVKNPDEVVDVITVGQLDSLMKNTVGVTDVIKGGKSLLHPVVTVELDPKSAASQALFGAEPELDITVGKREPAPRIPGIPTKKRSATLAEADTKKDDSASDPTIAGVSSKDPSTSQKMQEAGNTLASTSQPAKEPTIAKPSAQDPSTLPFRNSINDTDWKLFRSVADVQTLNEFDDELWKKYSIVIGSFRQESNANFVRRTFNGLGERTLLLKKSDDLYYVIVASYDSEIDVVAKLDSFTRKYTTNLSKSRRISRYGIPLDDMWILVK